MSVALESTELDRLATVEAELTYLAPMRERPHNYTYDPPPGVARSNGGAGSAPRADPRCPPHRGDRVAR